MMIFISHTFYLGIPHPKNWLEFTNTTVIYCVNDLQLIHALIILKSNYRDLGLDKFLSGSQSPPVLFFAKAQLEL